MLYFTWIHFFCVYTSYLACTGLLVEGSVGPVETVYANSLLTDLFLVYSSSCLGFSFPSSHHLPARHNLHFWSPPRGSSKYFISVAYPDPIRCPTDHSDAYHNRISFFRSRTLTA